MSSLPSVNSAANSRSNLVRHTPEDLTARLAFLAKVVYHSNDRSEVNFAKLIISERFLTHWRLQFKSLNS